MRYILNFNREAAELIGTDNTAIELSNASNKRLGANILVRGTDGETPAFSPKGDGSSIFKTRLSESTARTVGLRGSQRYTLVRRGQSESFYLVPHSQVRRSVRRPIDGPAVTVSLTERS